MAEIIDLDFYRKFRIILPVRSRATAKRKQSAIVQTVAKRYRRRQRIDPESVIKKKE
ncbi:MAG: hypothetical protein KA112_00970 [Alphaproteobacteria bacterium]|jgi:hypothetical protein|nr:hypothetical protein [Alphaproteobacteria bacterium]MBP7729172.1 hypothetical protein [Alphaproteobacteria bacterium]